VLAAGYSGLVLDSNGDYGAEGAVRNAGGGASLHELPDRAVLIEHLDSHQTVIPPSIETTEPVM
jgi:hypothetical protein